MSDNKLLDKIATSMNTSCLSDLRTISIDELLKAFKGIDSKEYSLKQWNYSLSYILDTEIKINTTDEIESILSDLK